MAARPFNRRQALQNQAFLEALLETGNPRLAARLLAVHRSTYLKRRAKCAAFAQDWDAALAAAHAAFHARGGTRAPDGTDTFPRGPGGGSAGARKSDCAQFRTRGGELWVGRTRGGRLQLRRAPPGWMTRAGEQAFCGALSATANVRLSAAACGFAHSAFYAKKRRRPAFARDMRAAIDIGCDRIEWALMERVAELFGEEAPWRAGAIDDNPLPPMTVDQCIHLVTLHQNRDRMRAAVDRARPGPAPFEETDEGRRRRAAERARHYEATGDWRLPGEEPPALPPLAMVTGWSKANPDRAKAVHNPDLPLFGGWRLTDWKRSRK